jgi:energy-coupling factor transporter ATP-binding protein EcfA2
MEPDIIVLDELTTGQDRGHLNKFLARMKMLNEAGKTIILISHDMDEVAEYASRTIVMKEGGYCWMLVPGRCFPGLMFLRRRPSSRICWPGPVMMCERGGGMFRCC